MKKTDKYKELFSKEYLMGPNSVRLLEELLEKYPLEKNMKVLDLGCGKGITSLFLAKETGATVFATDLWVSATENNARFNEWGVSENVVPIHADANDLPFSDEYFDAVVAIDSLHYVAAQPHFIDQKILPLIKPNGVAIIAMPGLKEEIHGNEPDIIKEWIDGEDNEYPLWHSREWWLNHIGKSDDCEIVMDFDLDSFDEAWNDWFLSGHDLALHDEEFFKKGVGQHLAVVGFVIKRIK